MPPSPTLTPVLPLGAGLILDLGLTLGLFLLEPAVLVFVFVLLETGFLPALVNILKTNLIISDSLWLQ